MSPSEFLLPPSFQGNLDFRINFPIDPAFNSKNIKTYVRFYQAPQIFSTEEAVLMGKNPNVTFPAEGTFLIYYIYV